MVDDDSGNGNDTNSVDGFWSWWERMDEVAVRVSVISGDSIML